MKERLLGLLNLKATESKYVFDLLSIQLFIGIAHSLINIVSFTFFIYQFSVTSIPYAYIAIAVVLLLLNLGYEKLEKKLSPLQLLRVLIASSALILLFFWTGLLLWNQSTIVFLLLIWSTLFYMITGYGYWGLVSLLFNIRESKRVFSIVGSGDIPAKLIGYLSTPFLIPLIGLSNLLLVAVGSLLVGFFLINRLIHKKRWEKIQHRKHSVSKQHHADYDNSTSLLSFFFKHKLIFTISLLSLLSYNVFNLIDYTFVTQIKSNFQNLTTLATYIAVFFAVGRLVAFVLKLVFTSRVIERIGIIPSLLITPVTLILFSTTFLFFGQGDYSLYLFGIMAMVTEVLRSAMQEPVFFILFQPLNEHHRLRGHIIAKGYMLAPSLFIVGASLIALNEFGIVVTIPFTIKLLLLNLFVWLGIIFYIRKFYSKALHTSIARGTFSGDVLKIFDKTTIDILLQKIDKGNHAEKIYALQLLENAGYSGIDKVIENQLLFGSAEMKKHALERMDHRGVMSTKLLQELMESEADEKVKEHVITMLCKHDHQFLQSMSNNVATLDYNMRKSIIIILLNHNEFDFLHKAGSEINALIKSDDPKERELAVNIIGELKNIKFTNAIEKLIEDEDATVRRNALIAACKLQNKTLLPTIFQKLQSPANKYLALQGLFQYGDELFTEIKAFTPEQLNTHQADLIKISAKIKGPNAVHFLLALLHRDNKFADKIIHVLWSKSFQAEVVADIFKCQALLNKFLKSGSDKILFHHAVPVFEENELIKRSIDSEIWNDLTTAIKICAILYPKKEINRIIELVENRNTQKLYNGMEMIEMILPTKIAKQINELFDYLLDPASLKRKVLLSDHKVFFEEIIFNNKSSFNSWTKAICLYTSIKIEPADFFATLKNITLPAEDIILTETKDYVLKAIQQPFYVNH